MATMASIKIAAKIKKLKKEVSNLEKAKKAASKRPVKKKAVKKKAGKKKKKRR